MSAPVLVHTEATPEVQLPTGDVLDRLASLEADSASVISLYVRLEVEDRVANRYRLAAREALRPLREAPETHPLREARLRDLDRLMAFLGDARRLPHSGGVALFACEALDLFTLVPLPHVAVTRAVLDVRPRLAEAVAVAPELVPVLVAAVDRGHARFFLASPTEVEELPCLVLPSRRGGRFHGQRRDAPGWGERDYHNRMREERHRHAADVAEELARMVAEHRCQGIVLAGPLRVTTEQLRFLPHGLRARVLDTARLNPTALTPDEIRRVALAGRAEAARRRVRALVAEFEEAVGTGWAVSGLRPTRRALERGQVRALLVRPGQPGLDEVVEEAYRQRAEVVPVTDPGLASRFEGFAAILRFR